MSDEPIPQEIYDRVRAELIDEVRAEVYADIAGIHEVSLGLRVGIHRLRRWIDRRDANACPLPVRTLSGMNVYSLEDWKGWFLLWSMTRGSETWNRSKDPDPDEI